MNTTTEQLRATVREGYQVLLRAEAEKEARIRKAEGEAEAILKINQAQAESIRLINQACPGNEYLLLKKLEAFEKVSDGQATKVIIPSDLQGVVGLVNTIAESTKAENEKDEYSTITNLRNSTIRIHIT